LIVLRKSGILPNVRNLAGFCNMTGSVFTYTATQARARLPHVIAEAATGNTVVIRRWGMEVAVVSLARLRQLEARATPVATPDDDAPPL
jgi:antitoxin (DNA-binding transcriptional repressor) of toxin-antitoxin stability system